MEKQQATLTQIERRNSGEDVDNPKRLQRTLRSSRNKKRAEFIKHLRNGSEELRPLIERFEARSTKKLPRGVHLLVHFNA